VKGNGERIGNNLWNGFSRFDEMGIGWGLKMVGGVRKNRKRSGNFIGIA
jgi:hypothetical protein